MASLEKQNHKIRERQGKADKRIKDVKNDAKEAKNIADNTASILINVIRKKDHTTRLDQNVSPPSPYQTWYSNNSAGVGIPKSIKNVNFDKNGNVSNFEFDDGNGNVVSVG